MASKAFEFYKGLKSPCANCPRRRLPPEPDCHNAEYCEPWGKYVAYKTRVSKAQKKDNLAGDTLAIGINSRKDKWIKSDDR